MWDEGAAPSLWPVWSPLYLTCAKNGAVVSDDEPSRGALRCGPCDALAVETPKPERPSVAEATRSTERLIDPDGVEGDLGDEDAWGQRLKGASKELAGGSQGMNAPLFLQGLLSRAGDCSERSLDQETLGPMLQGTRSSRLPLRPSAQGSREC